MNADDNGALRQARAAGGATAQRFAADQGVVSIAVSEVSGRQAGQMPAAAPGPEYLQTLVVAAGLLRRSTLRLIVDNFHRTPMALMPRRGCGPTVLPLLAKVKPAVCMVTAGRTCRPTIWPAVTHWSRRYQPAPHRAGAARVPTQTCHCVLGA